MSNALEQWFGDSIGTLELMERELAEHQYAAEEAMTAMHHHTSEINRLQRNIGVIRRALTDIESAEADEDYTEDEDWVTSEPAMAAAGGARGNTDVTPNPVLRIMPTAEPRPYNVPPPPPPPGTLLRARR